MGAFLASRWQLSDNKNCHMDVVRDRIAFSINSCLEGAVVEKNSGIFPLSQEYIMETKLSELPASLEETGWNAMFRMDGISFVAARIFFVLALYGT